MRERGVERLCLSLVEAECRGSMGKYFSVNILLMDPIIWLGLSVVIWLSLGIVVWFGVRIVVFLDFFFIRASSGDAQR
jgi:hypothetical protein